MRGTSPWDAAAVCCRVCYGPCVVTVLSDCPALPRPLTLLLIWRCCRSGAAAVLQQRIIWRSSVNRSKTNGPITILSLTVNSDGSMLLICLLTKYTDIMSDLFRVYVEIYRLILCVRVTKSASSSTDSDSIKSVRHSLKCRNMCECVSII